VQGDCDPKKMDTAHQLGYRLTRQSFDKLEGETKGKKSFFLLKERFDQRYSLLSLAGLSNFMKPKEKVVLVFSRIHVDWRSGKLSLMTE
jgi:hypothetical protein